MRTNQPHAFLLLLCFAACSLRAARLPVRHYTTADGLARNSVHRIIRDRDGFLWFATGEGISRFDGYSFTNYRRTDGLPDRDIRSIVQTADGSFLVATGDGAVRFRPAESAPSRRFQGFALSGGVRVRSFEAVIERGSTVWIGTDGGLYAADRAAQSSAVPALLNPGGIEPGILTIVRDPAQDLWVGTSNGLFVVDASGHAQRIALAGSPAPFVGALLVDTDGVWLGTGAGGLCKADFRKAGSPPRIECPSGLQPGLKKSAIKSLLRARDGSLWIGTVSGLARQAPDSPAVQLLGEPEGFLNGNVLALPEDGDGDVWAGYDGPGVLRVSAIGFVTYDGHDGLPASQVAALAVTPAALSWSPHRPVRDSPPIASKRTASSATSWAMSPCFPQAGCPGTRCWQRTRADPGGPGPNTVCCVSSPRIVPAAPSADSPSSAPPTACPPPMSLTFWKTRGETCGSAPCRSWRIPRPGSGAASACGNAPLAVFALFPKPRGFRP